MIAVYDITTSFSIHLMVYSANHGQTEYKRLRFGNFMHDSPKSAVLVFSWELLCEAIRIDMLSIFLPFLQQF